MQLTVLAGGILALAASTWASANAAAAQSEGQAEHEAVPIKATFLITGLHCPPCTRTVERSLQGVRGVNSIKVDWNTKNARIEYDEHVISAQRLSAAIAGTPHMMGGNLQYGGWLALKIADVQADDTAGWQRIQEVLGKLPGVKQLALYPARSGVGIQFDGRGDLTSDKLVAALAEAGVKASNY